VVLRLWCAFDVGDSSHVLRALANKSRLVNHPGEPWPLPVKRGRGALVARHVIRSTFGPRGVAVNSGLAIVGLTLLLVAALSRCLSSTPITPAMVSSDGYSEPAASEQKRSLRCGSGVSAFAPGFAVNAVRSCG
jgi:hypothetical protein